MKYVVINAQCLDGEMTVFEPVHRKTAKEAVDFCVSSAMEDYGYNYEVLEEIVTEETEEIDENPAPHTPVYTLRLDNECGHMETYTVFAENEGGAS